MKKSDLDDPSLQWFREEIQQRLRTDFHDGDWSVDPWWLRSTDEPWFAEHGWPMERRHAAVAGLKKLYPPSLCRELLLDPWEGGLVYFLFCRYFPWFITPLLEVAEEYMVVSAMKDKKLLRALRRRDTFSSAAFELSVWANLTRYGYRPDREPRTEKGTHPDFAVLLDHRRYLIELKVLHEGEIAALDEEVREAVYNAQYSLMDKGRDITIRPSETFLELTRKNRNEVERRLPELGDAIRAHEDQLRVLGFPEGAWTLSDFGTLEIKHTAPGEGGWLHVELVPPLSKQEQAGRCMAAIGDALHQLGGSARGWIIVAVGRGFTALREVYDSVRQEIGRDPATNWDAVMLFGWGQTIEGRTFKHIGTVLRDQKTLTIKERRMLEAMLS